MTPYKIRRLDCGVVSIKGTEGEIQAAYRYPVRMYSLSLGHDSEVLKTRYRSEIGCLTAATTLLQLAHRFKLYSYITYVSRPNPATLNANAWGEQASIKTLSNPVLAI